jgi:hypothetical protein
VRGIRLRIQRRPSHLEEIAAAGERSGVLEVRRKVGGGQSRSMGLGPLGHPLTLRGPGLRVESTHEHRSGITGELPEEQGASPQ